MTKETIGELNIENERIKKVLNTHLNKSYVELNKFKSLKNPSNPERVRKQIIIRDAEIMLLIRILKEIDGSKSVYEENEQLKLKNHELEEKVYNLLEDKQVLMNFIRERFPKNYETLFEEIQVH